jgi:hypothetical protein
MRAENVGLEQAENLLSDPLVWPELKQDGAEDGAKVGEMKSERTVAPMDQMPEEWKQPLPVKTSGARMANGCKGRFL